ncbi:hypothetical protein FC778_15325 [Clostridium botulinum]|nr:hypothetical protein [Clostridium botulinum]
MSLTNNYKSILEFVEQYGSISIEIAKDLFYNTKYGYDSSRRGLTSLVKGGYLKTSKDFVTDNKIYYNKKPISSHKLMLLKLYAKIIALGGEVIEFKKEYKSKKSISDGLIIYKYNGSIKIILIEIDINNKTKENKYIELYKSSYYQNIFGTFPRIIIIDKMAEKRKRKQIYKEIKFIYLEYEMEELKQYL